ncbi:Hypothetical protein FKW44_007417 [Caligus rogercresseyi]|uniref:Uncharacterized protein n=1 Tax=Caligus rogercresseyi TaxID=217165 RepID=A0A7T8KEQ1_CALRO|nr:Hypothetical protein FKW44_007417 [Caligus rogercresseyi]
MASTLDGGFCMPSSLDHPKFLSLLGGPWGLVWRLLLGSLDSLLRSNFIRISLPPSKRPACDMPGR